MKSRIKILIKDFLGTNWIVLKDEKRIFKRIHSRELDYNNPVFFNDHIFRLKLYWRSDLAKKCANKLTVREYIDETIGSNYLVPLILIANSPSEIRFEELPKSYVIKMSHGSGMNIIVNDSSKVNYKDLYRNLRKWTKIDFYYSSGEFVYKGSPRVILIEKNLINKRVKKLEDYKFFCFDGIPRVYYIGSKVFDDFGKVVKNRKWFTIDGRKIDFNGDDFCIGVERQLPNHILEMIKLSKELSKPFEHCRCDFYYVNSKVYFGEITFFHSSGMEKFPNLKFEKYLGSFFGG
jgi:hypothetical protein